MLKIKHNRTTENSWVEERLIPLKMKQNLKEGERQTDGDRVRHRERVKLSSLCKSGRFSYGESPRTPPLEGTSLHRRNNSVERPWGILSLFTTCLPSCVKSLCQVSVTCHLHRNQYHAFSEERELLLSARKNRTTKKKSSVDRDLRKSPKKRLRGEWNRIEC